MPDPTAFFLKGLLAGLALAMPVGPVAVLCIRRTLAEGARVGFATGFGASLADGFYGLVAALGLTAISGFLLAQRMWVTLLGGLILLGLGLATFLAKPREAAVAAPARGVAGAIASTFAITVTNPLTIVTFTAMFASLGLAEAAGDTAAATALVAGVFIGSFTWFMALSGTTSIFRGRVTPSVMVWINRASGTLIAGFGAYAVWSALS